MGSLKVNKTKVILQKTDSGAFEKQSLTFMAFLTQYIVSDINRPNHIHIHEFDAAFISQ
jgi:hypothetical protein